MGFRKRYSYAFSSEHPAGETEESQPSDDKQNRWENRWRDLLKNRRKMILAVAVIAILVIIVVAVITVVVIVSRNKKADNNTTISKTSSRTAAPAAPVTSQARAVTFAFKAEEPAGRGKRGVDDSNKSKDTILEYIRNYGLSTHFYIEAYTSQCDVTGPFNGSEAETQIQDHFQDHFGRTSKLVPNQTLAMLMYRKWASSAYEKIKALVFFPTRESDYENAENFKKDLTAASEHINAAKNEERHNKEFIIIVLTKKETKEYFNSSSAILLDPDAYNSTDLASAISTYIPTATTTMEHGLMVTTTTSIFQTMAITTPRMSTVTNTKQDLPTVATATGLQTAALNKNEMLNAEQSPANDTSTKTEATGLQTAALNANDKLNIEQSPANDTSTKTEATGLQAAALNANDRLTTEQLPAKTMSTRTTTKGSQTAAYK